MNSDVLLTAMKIILAVYYLLVDIVLLGQCFYYKGFSLTDKTPSPASNGHAESESETENTPLLNEAHSENGQQQRRGPERTDSQLSFRERLFPVDATHLSPATPLHPDTDSRQSRSGQPSRSLLQSFFVNFFVVILVVLAGILGWFLSNSSTDVPTPGKSAEKPSFNVLGQIFGYICSVLYLGSRVPQLLLNHRRRSTDGISMLFFLFACIGNATYNLSIFAFSPQPACDTPAQCRPGEAAQIYWSHILVNLSWILGSLGTLFLDLGVFVQYFVYNRDRKAGDEGYTISNGGSEPLSDTQ
jgi:hypothetical protein